MKEETRAILDSAFYISPGDVPEAAYPASLPTGAEVPLRRVHPHFHPGLLQALGLPGSRPGS